MLRQHQASLDDRKKFTALVKDLFPDQAKNVNLLLMAYNMGIAQDIQKANLLNNTFLFRSKEEDRRFRENSRLLADLMGIFLHMRKAAREKVLP